MDTALLRRVEQGADAAEVGDVLVSVWQRIATALTPIVGARGVGALYSRSLHLTKRQYPWLSGLQPGNHDQMDMAALRTVLAQQTPPVAAAGGDELLRNFHQLLTTLVGASLTQRLLRPVGMHLAHDNPPQDPSS